MFAFNDLIKQTSAAKKTPGTLAGRFDIKKADDDRRLAFPQGQTATQIKAVMVDPTIECGNGYHFVAEESKE